MCKAIITNRLRRIDPSRTTTLRNRFQAAMVSRLQRLKTDLRTSIVQNDCFGVRHLVINSPARSDQFIYGTDRNRLEQFMAWLRKQEEAGLLEVIHRPGSQAGIESAWTDTYIQSAYRQGIARADAEMRRAGIEYAGTESMVWTSFNQPIHANALGSLYLRTFEELKTVTSVMNTAIQRTIADGLRSGITSGIAEGLGADQIARNLMKDVANSVDTIGITRARMIARTEVIRAHHVANIAEYRQASADMQVTVLAELGIASDACPLCEELAAKGTYTLSEIETMIPAHPNCRCVAIPYIEDHERAAA